VGKGLGGTQIINQKPADFIGGDPQVSEHDTVHAELGQIEDDHGIIEILHEKGNGQGIVKIVLKLYDQGRPADDPVRIGKRVKITTVLS